MSDFNVIVLYKYCLSIKVAHGWAIGGKLEEYNYIVNLAIY